MGEPAGADASASASHRRVVDVLAQRGRRCARPVGLHPRWSGGCGDRRREPGCRSSRQVCGWSAPRGPGCPPTSRTLRLSRILARLEAAKPDIVFCAFGFPKQEKVIAACRERLPSTWFLGCGAAVNFAAGHETRAPQWMQKVGLEWFHRVCSEPRRLAGRYAADIPFALGLLVRSGIRGRFARALPVSVAPFPDEVVVLPDAAPARRDVIDVAHAEVGATAARIAPRNHG